MNAIRSQSESGYRERLESHRRALWGLCYRMTGNAADADELVQDTFVRALATPPGDTRRDLRPWLVRVAANLARDALRRRKTRPYVGLWLPSPVPTQRLREDAWEPASHEPAAARQQSPEQRYQLLESASMAFLVALEALTPKQRAVLLLRDVYEYSGAQTADALDISVADVKTSLHRARRAMAAYDRQRQVPSPEVSARTGSALGALLTAMAQDDHDRMHALIADEIRSYSDGGGEFFAARRPLVGRQEVTRLLRTSYGKYGRPTGLAPCHVNGLPAMLVTYAKPFRPGFATRALIGVELGADERVAVMRTIMASGKLTAMP